ncbi:MAG: zinc-finger domain-containing protein [Thiohalocapsa sp.]
MIPFETIEINEMVAACDGGGGALGHPRVYLNLAPSGRIECPYCSRQYVNRAVLAAGGVAEEAGVIMPSAEIPGQERLAESPAPRQVGDIARDPAPDRAGGGNG